MRLASFILILATLLTACSEKLPSTQTEDTKLWIECNLEAGKPPIARLMSTIGLSGIYNPSYPEDGVIYLSNGEENDYSFEYMNEQYVSVGENEIKKGQNFNIFAHLEQDDENTIETLYSVRVIDNIPFDTLILLKNELDYGSNGLIYLRLKFPSPLKEALADLHIDINLETVFEENNGGTIEEIPNQIPYMIRYEEFYNYVQNFEVMSHMSGVLFDTEGVDSDYIDLGLSIEKVLDANEKVNSINLLVKSTTDDYNKYHKWLSNELDSNSGNPSTVFTNIKNGYGALTSTASRNYQLLVN